MDEHQRLASSCLASPGIGQISGNDDEYIIGLETAIHHASIFASFARGEKAAAYDREVGEERETRSRDQNSERVLFDCSIVNVKTSDHGAGVEVWCNHASLGSKKAGGVGQRNQTAFPLKRGNGYSLNGQLGRVALAP
jgi:hypothetical protein